MQIILKHRGPSSWHSSRSFLRSKKFFIRHNINADRLNKRLASFNGPQARLKRPRENSWLFYPVTLLALSGVGYYAYEQHQPFRHAVLATLRCSRLAGNLFW